MACAGLIGNHWEDGASGVPEASENFPTKPGSEAAAGTLPRPQARPRRTAHDVVRRFGYLQLDTVSIAGARSHVIVLLTRIPRLKPAAGEELLRPGEPLFEYWGHEVCWMPIELYPLFQFRRNDIRGREWWGSVMKQHRDLSREILARIRGEGPLRSSDLEGPGSRGWWELKPAKRVLTALWSSGDLAIRERRSFQRTFDLTERVIPEDARRTEVDREESLRRLLLLALRGHGWATTGTLARTWRLINRPKEIAAALRSLAEEGQIVPCDLDSGKGKRTRGWIRPADLERAAQLRRIRPRRDQGVLLSPFDPLLWERPRVRELFDFDQVLEIFKPAPTRTYGYYCMPVLAGERLVARFDLKADRKNGTLRVLSVRFEGPRPRRPASPEDGAAARVALDRFARALNLETTGSALRTLPKASEID